MCGPCWRDTPFITGLVCDLCGTPLAGEDTGKPEHCDDCLTIARPWSRGRSALLYQDNARAMVLALSTGRPLAVLMVDVDHFKGYNDRYGHAAGDACLQALAGLLQAGLTRSHDLVARYGGEEFVCLLPDCDLDGALRKAEALRAAIAARPDRDELVALSSHLANFLLDGSPLFGLFSHVGFHLIGTLLAQCRRNVPRFVLPVKTLFFRPFPERFMPGDGG